MAKLTNSGAISLDDITAVIIQPAGGLQLVGDLPSSKLYLPTVEPLSNRVKNLRSGSVSQSSLVVSPAGTSAAPAPGEAAASPAGQPPTQQQTYMKAFRGTTMKRRAGRAATTRRRREPAAPDAAGDAKQPEEPVPDSHQRNCLLAALRSLYAGLSRAYGLVTGFGSAIDDSVSADYGTGVGAFFTIYRQCAMTAVVSAMAVFFFLVFPQLKPPPGFDRNALAVNNASRADAILGRDIKPQSLLYFGAYSNFTLVSSGYSLKNAYFFTGLGFLLFNMICVAKMLTTAVQEHYVQSSGELRASSLLATVFSAWDFSMRSPRAVAQRRSAIATSFKEMAVQIGKHQRRSEFSERASSVLQLLVVHVVSLFFIAVGVVLTGIMFWEHIYLNAEEQFSGANLHPSSGIFFACVVIGFYVILGFLRILSLVERHKDMRYNVTHPLVRNGIFTLVMVASLALLMYALIYCHSDGADPSSFTFILLGQPKAKNGWTVTSEANFFCWESWMAAQFYRLNLYDFYAGLVSSFLLEVVPKLLSLLPIPALKKAIRLNIDLGYNSASLTFSMALFWLGAFFSPPLTMLAALKLLVMFFYKWLILQQCFTPSLAGMGKLLTAKTITTFLFLNVLVAGIFTSFLVYSLPMSTTCGPFSEGGLLKEVYFDHTQAGFVATLLLSGTSQIVLLCLFLTLLVRMRSVAQGKEDTIRALKRYIVLENSECVRLNKQINARLLRQAELGARNQRRQYF